MNKKTITPNPQQPVDRIPTGQLPSALIELSEDALLSGTDTTSVLPTSGMFCGCLVGCSFDGDDE